MHRTYLSHASHAALNGVSQIFLQANRPCGLLMLVTIALYAPSLLAGTLLGLLSGTLTAYSLGYERHDIEAGLYGYNSTLLGLLITLVLGPSGLALLLVFVAGAFSSLLQRRLLLLMRERNGPAVFTLTFVLFGWLMLALADMLSAVAEARLPASSVDGWGALGAMVSGMGQVIFLAEPIAGLCLLLAVLIADRRAGLWALCGSAVGVYSALLLGTTESQALAGLAGYNPALAGLALSQVHRTALIPALGIALAIGCKLMFDHLNIPALTMPFILACWVVGLGTHRVRRQSETRFV